MVRITDKNGGAYLFIKKVLYLQTDKNEVIINYIHENGTEHEFRRKGKSLDLREIKEFISKQTKGKAKK